MSLPWTVTRCKDRASAVAVPLRLAANRRTCRHPVFGSRESVSSAVFQSRVGAAFFRLAPASLLAAFAPTSNGLTDQNHDYRSALLARSCIRFLLIAPRSKKAWYSFSGTNSPPVVQTMWVEFAMHRSRPWRARYAAPSPDDVNHRGPSKAAAAEGSILKDCVVAAVWTCWKSRSSSTVKTPPNAVRMVETACTDARGTANPSASVRLSRPMSYTAGLLPLGSSMETRKQGDATGSAKKQCTLDPNTCASPKAMPDGAPPTPQGRYTNNGCPSSTTTPQACN